MAEFSNEVHLALVSAATEYDRKLFQKDGNVYRLGLIFQSIERMEKDQEKTCCLHHALVREGFSDRILSAFEKALKLKVSYSRGSRDIERHPKECSDGKFAVAK